jgi:hypothetical protein
MHGIHAGNKYACRSSKRRSRLYPTEHSHLPNFGPCTPIWKSEISISRQREPFTAGRGFETCLSVCLSVFFIFLYVPTQKFWCQCCDMHLWVHVYIYIYIYIYIYRRCIHTYEKDSVSYICNTYIYIYIHIHTRCIHAHGKDSFSRVDVCGLFPTCTHALRHTPRQGPSAKTNRIHSYTHVHTFLHTCTYILTHMYIHSYTHVHTFLHTCTYIPTHMYIHSYTHVHTFLHTCTQIN